MFRVIFYLLITVLLISMLRGIIGIIFKAFGLMLGGGSTQAPRPAAATGFPLTGELKRDPACGTYIAAAGSLTEKVGGETFYFCSPQCRDKYVASLTR